MLQATILVASADSMKQYHIYNYIIACYTLYYTDSVTKLPKSSRVNTFSFWGPLLRVGAAGYAIKGKPVMVILLSAAAGAGKPSEPAKDSFSSAESHSL